jgi:hypothetical protein
MLIHEIEITMYEEFAKSKTLCCKITGGDSGLYNHRGLIEHQRDGSDSNSAAGAKAVVGADRALAIRAENVGWLA